MSSKYIKNTKNKIPLSINYPDIFAKMNITPQELKEKINYYEEKSKILKEHEKELQKKIEERDKEIKAKEKAEQKVIELNNSLELKVEQRTRLITSKSKKIKDLLDNTAEGFLSFGLNFYIDNEYSKECERIFGMSLIGENILDLLLGEDENKKRFYSQTFIDAATTKDKVVTKSFLSLLDKEFIINNKIVSVAYKLLEDEQYNLLEDKRFMLILIDITAKKKLEEKMKKEQQILKMIVSVVSDTVQFYDIKDDFDNFSLNKLQIINKKNSPLNNLNILYRQVHTFKGLFSQLFMLNSVENLHNFETIISDHIKNHSITNDDIIVFLEGSDFNKWIEEDIKIISNILGEHFFLEKSIIKVNKKSIDKLQSKISKYCSIDKTHANNYDDILQEVEKLKSIPIKNALSSYPALCNELAHKLGKELHSFEIIGSDDILMPKSFKNFFKSLLHIFRNCIDHGIESPQIREELGKDITGTITCSFEEENHNLIILISDDGAGIDKDKIKEKYLEKRLLREEELNRLSDNEILNLIFIDEFSLKESITDISGRGIGMSAVKEELEKIDGSVKIYSEINKGTTFMFTLPLQLNK